MELKNFNLTKAVGVALIAFSSNVVLAETVSVPASVTVNNAIDFTFTGTLNFGEIRANHDDTVGNCTGLTIPANPASTIRALSATDTDAFAICTAGTSAMQAIGGTPERPAFVIAGVAPFTTLNFTLPDTSGTGAPIEMTAGTAPPGSPTFDLYDFTIYQTDGSGSSPTISGTGTGTITATAAGAVNFVVGGTITTDEDTGLTGDYENLDYSANFDVTVTY